MSPSADCRVTKTFFWLIITHPTIILDINVNVIYLAIKYSFIYKILKTAYMPTAW